MTKYTNQSPEFHDELDIVDTSTPDNGDNISLADRQNFDNILVLKANIGTLSNLSTTAKANLVAAINEIFTKANGVGTLADLETETKTSLVAAINELVEKGVGNYGNAGFHNSIYRGESLGTEVTTEQYEAISAGTFDDMFIGDYWTINGTVYRIAAFDYWLHCGDTECTTHHVVVVPDVNMYTAQMNASNVTTGGYIGSAMYTANLAPAKTTINADFGAAHILTHREYLVNTVASGRPSAGSWYDSDIELMNEHMVYGKHFEPTSDGTNVPAIYTIDNAQLPLFALDHSKICNRAGWWLRDVVSAASFADVYNTGHCASYGASGAYGVRPAFGIKA